VKVEVDCRRDSSGWICEAVVGDDPGATRHEVRVSGDELDRLDPGAADPTALVRRSFAFLLAREPRESILRSFELPVIGRYFPEWEAEISAPPGSR
jgi:hypothetical protein